MIVWTVMKYIALIAAAIILIAIVIMFVLFWGKGQLVYAEDKEGVPYLKVDGTKENISIKQAIELARPHLQKSLEQIRIRNSRANSDGSWGGRTYVILKDKWYYIFKDDYPWKAPVLELPGRYDSLAIRVNIETGELILPVWPD